MKKAGFLRTGQAKVMKSRQAVPLNIKDKDLTPCVCEGPDGVRCHPALLLTVSIWLQTI